MGGVLLDQRERKRQWPDLAGETFASLRGGEPQAWAEAHRITSGRLEREMAQAAPEGNFRTFLRRYHLAWVSGMCAHLGIPVPRDDECLALAARAVAAMSRRVRAALPGAVEAVRTLQRQGYPLHTASGAWSVEVAGYLEGMEMRTRFGCPYGADLIDTFKDGPDYYARLFADLGIVPAEAIVVDDSAEAIAWATQAGTWARLVDSAWSPGSLGSDRIKRLADLPALLAQLE